MRKIIQVFGSLNAGGAESRMLDVFKAIDKSKYEFIFLTLSQEENQFYESEIKEYGGEIIKIPSPRDVGVFRHLKDLYKCFKNLSLEGATVVHAHTLYHCGLVLYAAKLAGIPIRIAHARNTAALNQSSLKTNIFINIGKYLIKLFATKKLALNEDTARFLYGEKSIKTQDYHILPNAIDIEKYRSPEPCTDLSSLSRETNTIVHIGRFQEMKNHEFIIDFFTEFNKLYPQSFLILVGDGPLKKQIEDKVSKNGLQNNVKFLGLRKDIPSILSHAKLFLFPSKFEGLGGCVLEAQASGIPCLVSDSIPKNVDMGLNLVKFVSLERPLSEWIKIAEGVMTKEKETFDNIYLSFYNKGFTLQNEIEELSNIYENFDNHNHHIQ